MTEKSTVWIVSPDRPPSTECSQLSFRVCAVCETPEAAQEWVSKRGHYVFRDYGNAPEIWPYAVKRETKMPANSEVCA